MIPWKHLPMADKRKSISGSVLRKDEKHWCSAITKYKEKSCSYTHIILLFLLHIYNITFFTWYCRDGGKWPFNVSWITLDGKQYIHTNRNKLIIRTFQHWNEAKQSNTLLSWERKMEDRKVIITVHHKILMSKSIQINRV